jgi:Domain of unknown function (DUF1918)
MKAVIGDEILVDSEHAGTPARRGEILEILEAEFGTRYRVRWDDGHETTIHPVAGTVRVRHSGSRKGWQQPEHAR